MNKTVLIIRLRLVAAVVALAAVRCGDDAGGIYLRVLPPLEGVYHAAFPDFGGPEDQVTAEKMTAFENLVGKDIVWAYFSDNWMGGIKFPAAAVQTIWASGSVPFIRMMPRSALAEDQPEPVYNLQRIIDGAFDADLRAWARDARDTGIPLMVEFGTEVNGEWFPWNGKWNGGGATGGYGDPVQADGPERFRDAYRHVVDLFRAEGVNNVTWVYHVNRENVPAEPWNTMAAYYPGDDYVDWLGISVYGSLFPGDEWITFTAALDDAYAEFAALAPEKPLAVLEWSVCEDPARGDKAAWITDALSSIEGGRWPRVVAMSWWNEKWQNDDGSWSDLRVNSSPEALAAYRDGVASAFFVTEPRYLRR